MPAKRFDRVFQQHGDGHRADAFGNGRDRGAFIKTIVKINVAAQLAVFQTVNADVNDNGAFFNPAGFNGFRFSDRGDQNIGITA